MRTALVIGTGLVGTSAALALSGRSVHVHLVDHDPESARTAAALGAGSDEPPGGRILRDAADSGRKTSPLAKADDAVEVDTTDLTLQQVIECVVTLVEEKRTAA
ncbi:Cytidylate kinase [Streptomyces cyaneofuscatus]